MPKVASKVAHIPDIAWIIALWKAIHGGDPAPSDHVIAAGILAEAVSYLSGHVRSSVDVNTLATRFEALGLKLDVSEADTPPHQQTFDLLRPSGNGSRFVQLCYGVPPARKCLVVQLPRVAPPPE